MLLPLKKIVYISFTLQTIFPSWYLHHTSVNKMTFKTSVQQLFKVSHKYEVGFLILFTINQNQNQ